MSKSRGPEQTPPETTKDLDPSPTHAPEGFGAMDMSPEGLHERSLGNSERASRLGLGGADNTPALSDLDVEDWMNEPEASDVEQAPLPYKSELERGFGADLSGVTVRLGAREELDAQGAEATAEGETLSFASTHPDRELVAHEVAHLVQSREHGGSTSGRLSDPNEAAEQEADEAAKTVAEGGQVELEEGVTGVMRKKTKTPKNNAGETPSGSKLSERWGFKIMVKGGYRDRFRLRNPKQAYFGDGSKYWGRGAGSRVVYVNFSRIENFSILKSMKRVTAVMVHGDEEGGNFFVDIENIVRPKGVSKGKFNGEIHRQCKNNIQPPPKQEARFKSGLSGADVFDQLKYLVHDNKDVKKIIAGKEANPKNHVYILSGMRNKKKGEENANLLTDYIAFRMLKKTKTQLYLSMNLPKDNVASIPGNVLSRKSIDPTPSTPTPSFAVRAEESTKLYYQARRKGRGIGKKAEDVWGTATWRYLETTINGNPIRGWVLWDVKKRK